MAVVTAACSRKPPLPEFGKVPVFVLKDQNAEAFKSSDKLAGHVWVADFFFTMCPGPCPRMSTQMNEVQTALHGKDVKLLSISIDPEEDTPEVLTQYAKRYKADPAMWHFVTGPQPQLNYLAKDVFKLGVVDGSMEHSTRFVLIDKKSTIRGFYLTSEEGAIPKLIADAKDLLEE